MRALFLQSARNMLIELEDSWRKPQPPSPLSKALLPYQHARLGEKGKKESAKDRAHAITGKAKFSPKGAPPTLRIVE